ncbi:MAG: hypothetical protein WBC70_04985 [Candidatus Aminicenantales bacterium]
MIRKAGSKKDPISVRGRVFLCLKSFLIMVILLAFFQAASADLVEQGVKDSRPSGLLAGLAKINIDPAVGIPHMNWGSASHIVATAIDPVGNYLRALVLSDGKQKFALVDVDAGSPAVADEAIKRASELTGIPDEHIRLGADHSHADAGLSSGKGPTGADLRPYMKMMETYQAEVADKLVGVIVEANSKLRPVHAYGMVGTGHVNINRRFRAQGEKALWPAVGLNPEGFVDRELPVIRIDDAQGNPYAVLVNFQAHGTVLAYENRTVSADWPGNMRKTVETCLPGATCIFFQGAAGNQGPIEGYTGDLEVAHRLGAIMGHEAVALALRISTVKREPQFEGYVESSALQAKQPHRVLGPHDATLKYASKILELPSRIITQDNIDRMTKLKRDAEKNLRSVQQAGGSEWELNQAAARLRRWSNLLDRYKRPADPKPVMLEIAVLRIGEMALLFTNGELFAEIGAALKKTSPFKVTMFCGYGNRVGGGYMPTKEEFALGGYEVDGTRYGPDAAEKFIEESIDLLKSVR